MDVEEVARCAVLLERYNADRSYGNVLTLLGDLDKVTAEQLEQLESTDVVTCLHGLLKSCSDDAVKKSARSLLSKWKRPCNRDAEASSRVSPQQEASGGSRADPAQTRDSQVASSSGTKDGSSASSVRSKCVQLLLTALGPDPPDRDKAADLAADVERRIHELHSSSQLRYKVCVRSKVANLRNPHNGHLRQGLLGGSLSPEAFARMSAEEMASAELRRLREEYSSRGVSERQLPRGTEGTRTQKIRCKRCGGSDCSVTQVSRGALFLPAWVRQSGPDEDAMTFVTCSGCGQQWYHSGWVCL